MTTDALLFARVVARVAYYIIITTKCATRVRWMPTTCHHASFIDTLFNKVSGFQSVGSLRLAISVNHLHRPVATSGNKWHPVTSSGNKWHPVTSSGNKWHSCGVQWQQVSPGGNAIALRSFFSGTWAAEYQFSTPTVPLTQSSSEEPLNF